LFALVLLCNAGLLYAQSDQPVSLTIADPFIELHTGPGTRYPIFHVIDRGQQIVVLKRKTRWYKIRAENGKTGWASREQIQLTLLPSGEQLKFAEDNQDAFVQRQWEIGATTGELENAPILSLYGAYAFTQNLFTEFSLGYSVGNVSSSNIYKLNLLMQPFPEWSYSPFFTLGMGTIQVKPNATLVDPTDKKNSMSQVGFGFKTYLSRQFILRFEVNEYIIFSANNDTNENEDITEWKIGFAIFF
ncbi:MAG: SH3 domain-containing protein, partial [Gammaproteobacteria bacterium]|nr:SH3 domain-containing protein [Gammaproteobacteria bacterium]